MHRIHRSKGVVLTLAVVTGLALAGCADQSPKHEFIPPSHVEHVEGSETAHVTLTAKAAERTGIKVATVTDTPVSRKQTFPGEVVSHGGNTLAVKVASSGQAPSGGTATVRPLVQSDASWTAHQVAAPGSGELQFEVENAEGLVAGQRVGVELALSTTHRKTVPYSSVIYDENGKTWVYTSPEHLNYVRVAITIDYIEGDVAVLKDGPPNGTEVVSVGAVELYGAEFEVGH